MEKLDLDHMLSIVCTDEIQKLLVVVLMSQALNLVHLPITLKEIFSRKLYNNKYLHLIVHSFKWLFTPVPQAFEIIFYIQTFYINTSYHEKHLASQ